MKDGLKFYSCCRVLPQQKLQHPINQHSGKQRTGVSEMRIQIDGNSYSYQLYEKDCPSPKYTLDGANATEYFVCDASAIQKLADQMSKTYNEEQL